MFVRLVILASVLLCLLSLTSLTNSISARNIDVSVNIQVEPSKNHNIVHNDHNNNNNEIFHNEESELDEAVIAPPTETHRSPLYRIRSGLSKFSSNIANLFHRALSWVSAKVRAGLHKFQNRMEQRDKQIKETEEQNKQTESELDEADIDSVEAEFDEVTKTQLCSKIQTIVIERVDALAHNEIFHPADYSSIKAPLTYFSEAMNRLVKIYTPEQINKLSQMYLDADLVLQCHLIAEDISLLYNLYTTSLQQEINSLNNNPTKPSLDNCPRFNFDDGSATLFQNEYYLGLKPLVLKGQSSG